MPSFVTGVTPASKMPWRSIRASQRHRSRYPQQGGAFEAALLIAVRERELGMFPRATFDRARELAATLPPALPPAIAPSVMLDAAELFIGDTAGMDPEQRAQSTGREWRPLEPTAPARRALDNAPATDVVAAYLGLAIDCEQPRLRDAIDMATLQARFGMVPLMQFRAAICARGGGGDPQVLRLTNPRWADTLLAEARSARAGSPARGIDLPQAVALLTLAREAFPESFPVTLLWADTNQSLAEFDAALSGFESVIAKAPTHRDALLGRLTSLSYLMRHDDAIAAATRLIELGTWHIGDSYYWRAWNYYHRKSYEPAWQDVEKALTLLSNSSVYMLAGLIKQRDTHHKAIVTSEERAAQAAFNAAGGYARLGKKSLALNHVAMAIAHPKMKEKAEVLKAEIEKLP